MSAKAGKRPLRSLTAHEKLDAIRRVHDGESKASVARDIGVPESTLRGWCKNEDKISYLSRQSSPDTDESMEHKDKRLKLDDGLQPFNLSLKTQAGGTFSPNSDARYSLDYKDLDKLKHDSKSQSERERNRAELARLSVELGLNRPEMFLPSLANSNLSELTANIGLLAQWNTLLLQQQQKLAKKTSTSAVTPQTPDTTTSPKVSNNLLTTVDDKLKMAKPPSDKQSVHESVWYWLKTQQAMLGLNQPQNTAASLPSSTSSVPSALPDKNSWFWKWYKLAYNQQANPDKPILYQQLTKDNGKDLEVENLVMDKEKDVKEEDKEQKPKSRSVLDNLLNNNNNNVENRDGVEEVSQEEAVEHGEKFLRWLESCSDPNVTAMQIMQFRTLLNNVKSGNDRKNGESHPKAKVKRK